MLNLFQTWIIANQDQNQIHFILSYPVGLKSFDKIILIEIKLKYPKCK